MSRTIRALHRDEGGWAVLTAMLLLVIMLGVGAATYGYVDGQTQQSRVGRVKESAFNTAEAVMNAQIFQLGRDWPANDTSYPSCTQASTAPRCPSTVQLRAHFASPDIESGMTWATSVRDNDSSATLNYYSDELTQNAPGWDRNRDGKLWVRAEATAMGKTRTIIALVRSQQQAEDLPRAAVLSGRLDISNNGHKAIIDASGGSSESGLVAVRCTPVAGERDPCLGHPLGDGPKGQADNDKLLDHQISPNITQVAYSSAPAMTEEARERMKFTAISNGSYYASGCPTEEQLTAQVVYIENGNCFYRSNIIVNSPTNPGLIMIANGSITLAGTMKLYGIIYHINESNSPAVAVKVEGDAEVKGGILVDGNGVTVAGSSHLNVQLDLNAYSAVRSYGSVGIVQNTWREITSR